MDGVAGVTIASPKIDDLGVAALDTVLALAIEIADALDAARLGCGKGVN